MAYLTVAEQDAQMRRYFPAFKLMFDAGWYAYWEGPLTPICQTYRIRVCLIRRKFWEGYYLTNPYECITVIDPPIGPDPRNTGEPPQHVYRLGYPEAFPRLCVHDPAQEEWTPEMSIAEVLIPMVIKWFIFHEDWVDAGVWRGGGRHPEPIQTETPWRQQANLNPEMLAQRERSLNAAFHRLGRKIGVFGSYLWMAAESAAYFLPPFSQSLSGDTAASGTSASFSILLQEPPQAESWPWALAQEFRPKKFVISTSNAAKKSFPHQNTRSQAA